MEHCLIHVQDEDFLLFVLVFTKIHVLFCDVLFLGLVEPLAHIEEFNHLFVHQVVHVLALLLRVLQTVGFGLLRQNHRVHLLLIITVHVNARLVGVLVVRVLAPLLVQIILIVVAIVIVSH